MKKLIIFLSIISFYASVSAQAPSKRSGDFVTAVDEYSRAGKLSGLAIYPDTLVFNGTNGLDSVGSKIYVRSGVNVGEWTREYNGVSQNHWVKVGSGGGGSGCTTFYVTSDSLYFVRDSCGTLDSTQIVGDGSGGNNYHLPYNGNSTDYLGGDTIYHALPTVPAQFNPIAGTNISLSGTYPNITFNASGSTGVSTVTGLNTDNTDPINPIVKVSVDGATITGLGTPASPLVATASGTALNGTGFVKMTGTTPSYITSPIDSGSYHIIVVPSGDSLLVFEKPNGQSDTISLALLQYWKKNLNNIYYNGGNVGIGTDTPYSKLEIIVDSIGTNVPPDSKSIMLMNRAPVTSSITGQYSGSFIFGSGGWDAATSLPMGGRLRMYSTAPSNINPPGNHNYPTFIIDGSIDSGKTYTQYATLSKREAGGLGSLTTGYISVTQINSANLFNTANLTTGFGATSNYWSVGTQLSVGGTTRDSSASITQNSTNLGILPNRLTTAQRDAINMYVSSVTITNPGTGYTSPPTVAFTANASPINTLSARATGTAVLSGSTVGSITITNSGYYNTPPAITFTGGGGTGAAATAVLTQRAIPDGLTIYCTDCIADDTSVGVTQTYQISTLSWKNHW